MNRVKLWTGILLIFVAGALAGSLVTGSLIKHRIVKFRERESGARKAFLMKKLTRDLNLTQTQQVKIAQIIDQTHEKLFQLREKERPEFHKITEQSFELMKKVLNEEQKQKLDEIRQRFKRRFRKHGRPGMPPPPPPPLP